MRITTLRYRVWQVHVQELQQNLPIGIVLILYVHLACQFFRGYVVLVLPKERHPVSLLREKRGRSREWRIPWMKGES